MSKVRYKPFIPKSGDPGTVVGADDGQSYRQFAVWSAAPGVRKVWTLPVGVQEGDAPVYLVSLKGRSATPHHLDGTPCRPRVWHTPLGDDPYGQRHEEPCQHHSHRREQS